MKKGWIVLIVIVLLAGSWLTFTPQGKATWNKYIWTMKKVDDRTLYEKRKLVEDTCRAMISSYTSDKLTYEQYKESDSEEKQGWAEQAKMRANKTASTYNNYVLQNSYVWEENIPDDINTELKYID